MVGTRDKFSQTYGRFEVRARFPATTTGGVRGGFWMFPVDRHYGDSGWDCRVEDVTSFHTYTVVWRPSVIRFYIDGKTCFSRMPTPDSPQLAPQPFDREFSMILNLGVLTQGLSWRTKFPAELVVDYAKAWREPPPGRPSGSA